MPAVYQSSRYVAADHIVVPPPRAGWEAQAYRYTIVGAGCAGLNLALSLADLGVDDPILLIDERTYYQNDRTWCFWNTPGAELGELSSERWNKWSVVDAHGEAITATSSRYCYSRLRAIDFYRFAIDKVCATPNITFVTGETITGVEAGRGRPSLTARSIRIHSERMFDSTGLSRHKSAPRPNVMLQHFLGCTVEASHDVFEPSCPVLMDFRVSQSEGPHFVYVLPLSHRTALVENTYLSHSPVSPDRHRQEIAEYLQTAYGLRPSESQIVNEEAGCIPLTMAIEPSKLSDPVYRIGLTGAAARPSSGYAFQRIQRHSRWLAKAIVHGSHAPNPLQNRRRAFLDRIFLRVLETPQTDIASMFFHLFRDTPADTLVRFLSDESSLFDDLRVIRSLPFGPFLNKLI